MHRDRPNVQKACTLRCTVAFATAWLADHAGSPCSFAQPPARTARCAPRRPTDARRGVQPSRSTSSLGHNETVPNRPYPTYVFHMTRVEHLGSIATTGLLSDSRAQSGAMTVEIGNQGIKARRRSRVVDVGPGGVVADYAPFYFNPRSPMQSSIYKGNVPSYSEGTARLVFLVSSTQRLRELGLGVVVSDRNAVLTIARFTDTDDLDDLVNWAVIRTQYWNDHIDGSELRQAECLVHQWVPWEAFLDVGVQSEAVGREASALLQAVGVDGPTPTVRPRWYF